MEKIISHATDIDSSKKKVEHISILDFLRGFAAVSVMFFHFASCKGLVKFSSPILSNLFPWGNKGVDIFFVISGFIIPYSLWNTEYKLKEFLRFMAKRFMRIAPPAYVCLLLIIIQWIIVDSYIKHQVVTRL